MFNFKNMWATLFVNGFIAVGIASVVVALIMILNREFRARIINLVKSFVSKLKKAKKNK